MSIYKEEEEEEKEEEEGEEEEEEEEEVEEEEEEEEEVEEEEEEKEEDEEEKEEDEDEEEEEEGVTLPLSHGRRCGSKCETSHRQCYQIWKQLSLEYFPGSGGIAGSQPIQTPIEGQERK